MLTGNIYLKHYTLSFAQFYPPFLIKSINNPALIIKKAGKISIKINPFFKGFALFIYRISQNL